MNECPSPPPLPLYHSFIHSRPLSSTLSIPISQLPRCAASCVSLVAEFSQTSRENLWRVAIGPFMLLGGTNYRVRDILSSRSLIAAHLSPDESSCTCFSRLHVHLSLLSQFTRHLDRADFTLILSATAGCLPWRAIGKRIPSCETRDI